MGHHAYNSGDWAKHFGLDERDIRASIKPDDRPITRWEWVLFIFVGIFYTVVFSLLWWETK